MIFSFLHFSIHGLNQNGLSANRVSTFCEFKIKSKKPEYIGLKYHDILVHKATFEF